MLFMKPRILTILIALFRFRKSASVLKSISTPLLLIGQMLFGIVLTATPDWTNCNKLPDSPDGYSLLLPTVMNWMVKNWRNESACWSKPASTGKRSSSFH